MPTFSQPERLQAECISVATLHLFRQRLRQRLYALVLDEFRRREQNQEITRASLARKIRKKPEQLTRWLSAPGNWTLDTLSDLLLGMGLEPAAAATSLLAEEQATTRMESREAALQEVHCSTAFTGSALATTTFTNPVGTWLVQPAEACASADA